MPFSAEKICSILAKYKVSLTNEIQTQNDIERILDLHDIPYIREYRVDDKNIIDFLIDNSIGVEIKIKGSPSRILNQLVRYSETKRFESLILITAKTMQVDSAKITTPFYLVNLSRALLC